MAALKAPVFVLTGGDPLKRPDVFELVEYASSHGVRISLTPSATPLLTKEAIVRLKACGLARLAISLDGPTAEVHDAFRRVPGSYEWTLQAVRWAREIGLPVQINTLPTRIGGYPSHPLGCDPRHCGCRQGRPNIICLKRELVHSSQKTQYTYEGD